MTSLSERVAADGPLPADEVDGHIAVSDKMAGVSKFKVTGAYGDGLRPGVTTPVYYDVHTHTDADIVDAFLSANEQLRDAVSLRSLLQALCRGAGLDRDAVGPAVRSFYGEDAWDNAFSSNGARRSGTSLSTYLSSCDTVSEALEEHESDGGDADEAA